MIQCKRIDVSERIDINKSNKLKECLVCHYWYFKDIAFNHMHLNFNHMHVMDAIIYR